MLDSVNWASVFAIDTPLLEIFVRGSAIYLSIFVMMRFIMRRQLGNVGITDLLVIVMIADAAQNGMAGDYKSVPDGIFLIATLMFWDFMIDWVAYHIPAFNKLIDPPPIVLIRHGKLLRRNLRHELLTVDEIEAQMRMLGIDDYRTVKRACMEADGRISAITMDGKRHDGASNGVSQSVG